MWWKDSVAVNTFMVTKLGDTAGVQEFGTKSASWLQMANFTLVSGKTHLYILY